MTTEPPNEATSLPATELFPTKPLTFAERHGLSPVAFALISLVVIFFLYQIIGGTLTFLLFGGRLQTESIQWLRLMTMAAQVLLILIPTIFLARLQADNVRERLRLRLTGSREIFFAVIGVLSLQQLLQLYLVAQDQIPIPQSIRPLVDQLRKLIEETYKNLVSAHSVPELLYVLLVVAIVPAVCEELLFRGLIQKNFEVSLKRWWGIVVPGVIFGVYHLNPFSLVPLAILGIYFGFLVFRSGSILTSIVAHFVNNLFAVVAVFLNADENFFLSGNTPSFPVSMVILTLGGFGFLFVVSTYAFIRLTR